MKRTKLLLLALSGLLGLLCATGVFRASAEESPPAAPRVFGSDGRALVVAKKEAAAHRDAAPSTPLAKLIKDADKAMTEGPYAVTQKKHPSPSGDPHDYVSLAPYFWPNPRTADGLPYVRRDGERNPEVKEYDADRFTAMSNRSYTLALACYLTGREQYGKRAARLLRTWFLDAETRMNPNLNHAQFVKGVNDGRGTGVLESDRLLAVVDAIGLLEATSPAGGSGPAGAWTADDRKGFDQWLRQYVTWMRESKGGKAEAAATNNHGTWYDVQIVTFLLFLGEKADAARLLEEAKSRRIAAQIEPDGSMPRELTRTKSFGYTVFNLQAMTQLADLGEMAGVDLWHYKTEDRRGIRAAIDWTIPYATGEKQWEHEQIGGLSTNSTKGLFQPLRRAAAAYHDPALDRLAEKLAGDVSADRDEIRFPPVAAK